MLCYELCKDRYMMLFPVCLSVFLNLFSHFINTIWAVISMEAGSISFSDILVYLPHGCQAFIHLFIQQISECLEHQVHGLKDEQDTCGLFPIIF